MNAPKSYPVPSEHFIATATMCETDASKATRTSSVHRPAGVDTRRPPLSSAHARGLTSASVSPTRYLTNSYPLEPAALSLLVWPGYGSLRLWSAVSAAGAGDPPYSRPAVAYKLALRADHSRLHCKQYHTTTLLRPSVDEQ